MIRSLTPTLDIVSDTMRIMKNSARSTALAVAAALAATAATAGAQVTMPVAPQSNPVVLKGATIHTVTKGTIQNGTIVLDKGKITAIGGPEVQAPRAAKIVDVTGKHIYPGLIDAYSTVGITEIGSVDVSNDINELGDFNPNIRAEIAVNAESRHIGTTRSAGVLVAFTTPEGGVISGLSSAMSLEGWTWEEMSMKGAAALNVKWPDPNARPGGRFGGGGVASGRGGRQALRPTECSGVDPPALLRGRRPGFGYRNPGSRDSAHALLAGDHHRIALGPDRGEGPRRCGARPVHDGRRSEGLRHRGRGPDPAQDQPRDAGALVRAGNNC